MEAVVVDDQANVAGHLFTAQLPGERCLGCGAVAIDGLHVRRFELSIAAALAKTGQRGHQAFRYMRGVLDLTAEGVAQLCGVDAELVELWESGRLAVGARARALVAALVVSKAEDRAVSVDGLAMLRGPRVLARHVRLSIDGAGSKGARSADFGRSADGEPALA
ncbi:MAG: hypothetical protein NVS4B10_07730 [Myxococcales bacterium]